MTYVVCLIYIAVVYLRPGELVPAWADLRIAAIALIVAGVTGLVSLAREPRRFANLPNDLCFLGFCLASILSNPASGRFAAGYDAFVKLLPLVAFYLLIRLAVRTASQLRWLIVVIVVLTLFQATNGIVQYWTGVGAGGSTAVVEGMLQPDPDLLSGSSGETVRRVRGTGIFGDPNDLAMSLVLVFPFLFSAILSRDARLVQRLLGGGVLATVMYSLYLTQSRGGFLGLAALGAAYAYRRFGRWAAVIGAVLLVGLLLAAPGRIREMSSSEESAQSRVQAWEAGFEMLKSKPVLGVGFGEFINHYAQVAHNSFVHVFAETGFIGGFLFVGMFYWFFVANGSGRNVAGAAQSTLARDLWASGVGVTACACFLSQQYVPVLYVPLVLGAVRVSAERQPNDEAPVTRWWDWGLVLLASLAVVLAILAVVRTLVASSF